MRYIKSLFMLGIILSFTFIPRADASTVKQFNLDEMTINAGKIFRARVTNIKSGTLTIGGGTLSTTTYVLDVSETLKGETIDANGKLSNTYEITMLGSLKKPAAKNGIKFVGGFTPPRLIKGAEYLLFTTNPSNAGLSMTLGMGQGAFKFAFKEKVVNESMNSGLFRDMSTTMSENGPISYSAISEHVRNMLGTQGGKNK